MSHDPFFTARRCQRCGGSLDGGRTMSMFNSHVICMACKEKERQRPDYRDAVEAEMKAVRNGDRNFKGIGLKGGEMSEKKTQSGIHVKLIGQDGNIFNLIGIVLRALRRNGRSDLCEPFKQAVTSSHSYQEALAKIMEFIIVE